MKKTLPALAMVIFLSACGPSIPIIQDSIALTPTARPPTAPLSSATPIPEAVTANTVPPASIETPSTYSMLGGCPMFPADNIWNARVGC